MSKISKIVLFAMAGAALAVQAEVKVAPIFSDNMVLQRDRMLPVWGKADAGEAVSVSFGGETKQTVADANGKWRVDLSPKAASTDAQEMIVKGASNTITVKNVLVGEVWLCSGQSNMEMPLWSNRERWRTTDGDKAAVGCDNPLIRTVKIRPYGWSPTPVEEIEIAWEPLTEANALAALSASAFYFGTKLQPELGVPVGLITSHWGGTRIEPWTPVEGFESVPELHFMLPKIRAALPGTQDYQNVMQKIIADYQDYQKKVEDALAAGEIPPAPPEPEPVFRNHFRKMHMHQTPVYLYNRMIYAFVPYALRGAIWYQGCANRGDGLFYQYKMQALLNGWRQVFENPDMSFYFAQLAPYSYGKPDAPILPFICMAQERFAEANGDNVAMVVLNDSGNYNDIHPANKKVVGHRLANLALKYDYGRTDLKAESPRFLSCTPNGNTLVAEFANVERFTTKDHFEEFMQIAGDNGKFYPAKIQFDGNRMILSSPDVAEPTQVRYLWKNCSEGRIFNEAGLPLGVFHYEKNNRPDQIPQDAQLLYTYEHFKAAYLQDFRGQIHTNFNRIYFHVEAETVQGEKQWAVVGMDAFTNNPASLEIPQRSSKICHQTKVTNLSVHSNLDFLLSGDFPEGSVEIWPNNYGPNAKLKLPGASNGLYDFDDTYNSTIGYGSFQVHNFQNKQTVFAFNNWKDKKYADFGFGNSPVKNPDWTFTQSAQNYSSIKISVYLGN